jgi:hypothetical protein
MHFIKSLDQILFYLFIYLLTKQGNYKTLFQNPYLFHIKWPTFKSLAKRYRLDQFLKSFGFSLVEPESKFEEPKLSDIKNSIHCTTFFPRIQRLLVSSVFHTNRAN